MINEMNKTTYQPRVKGTAYQFDFYMQEMIRNLVDSNYSPIYAKVSKKEKDANLQVDPSFGIDKAFWGNTLFPSYNRIHYKDQSGLYL